jgi:mannose-1-phosphate guanylyltransferase
VVDYLSSFEMITEIIIVADIAGLGGQIRHYFADTAKNLKFVQDSSSGTAGDLRHLYSVINEPFVLWFVDNLGAINLKKMYEQFVKQKSVACIATRRFRKEETGFARVDKGKVTKFIEKPLLKMPYCECTGIYIMSKTILDIIKRSKSKNPNLSYDILQKLSKQALVSSYDIGKTPWIDIESPTTLEREDSTVRRIIKQMAQRL